MALKRISFSVSGEGQYERAFAVMGAEAEDLSRPMGEAGDYIVDTVREQFATEGARSRRWEPLDDDYARWKEAHFPARKILHRSGDMEEAATDKELALRVDRNSMRYTVHSDYAGYHQAGSGDLPIRKLVNLTEADRRLVDRTFVHWLHRLRSGPLRRAA